jgi:hypothetical protein
MAAVDVQVERVIHAPLAEVAAYAADPSNARLVMATAQGPFPMRTEYTWETAADGTRMTLRNTGEPSGFASVAAPVMEAALRRATSRDLERLARIFEGRA